MKQFLIRFKASYYCQGYEWDWFERLVFADTFEDACNKLKNLSTFDWEKGTPKDFKNLNIWLK